MPKLPSFTPSELISILLKNGFIIDRIKGSHHMLLNKEKNNKVIFHKHKKDLPKDILHEIIKQFGFSLKDIL